MSLKDHLNGSSASNMLEVPQPVATVAFMVEDEEGVVAELDTAGNLSVYSMTRLERLAFGWDLPDRSAIQIVAKLILMATRRH